MRRNTVTLLLAVLLTLSGVGLLAAPALAHRDGCHRWHSCPSDTGSYSCGDAGYACRYPTYGESLRGQIPDPTYEDYGFTDRGAPDYEYGYSDACPAGGCSSGTTTGVSGTTASEDVLSDVEPGIAVREREKQSSDGSRSWLFWSLGVGAVWLITRGGKPRQRASTSRSTGPDAPDTRSAAPGPASSRGDARTNVSSECRTRLSNIGDPCPCGGRLVLRHRRSDGHSFLGCSRFSQGCRRTRTAHGLAD